MVQSEKSQLLRFFLLSFSLPFFTDVDNNIQFLHVSCAENSIFLQTTAKSSGIVIKKQKKTLTKKSISEYLIKNCCSYNGSTNTLVQRAAPGAMKRTHVKMNMMREQNHSKHDDEQLKITDIFSYIYRFGAPSFLSISLPLHSLSITACLNFPLFLLIPGIKYGEKSLQR